VGRQQQRDFQHRRQGVGRLRFCVGKDETIKGFEQIIAFIPLKWGV
jgi:hypothetical protein